MRVLVTRPEPGNKHTAKRLVQAGFTPVLLPLTEVKPVVSGNLEIAPDTEAVAITSPNALRFASEVLLSKIRNLPVYAVGATSARFAQACGLTVSAQGNGGASELAGLMAKTLKHGARIAYPCGKVRRPDFEARMRDFGYQIDAIETYDTVKVSYFTKSFIEIVGNPPIDAVLFHSANSAVIANELLDAGSIPQITENTRFFCFSDRIATALKSISRDRISVAAGPTDAGLIAELHKIFP